MDQLKQWYLKHTALTHVLATIITFLVAAYFQVPQFHSLVVYYYGLLPQGLKQIIATGILLYGFYRNSYKQPPVPPAA
jgi:hypothetical protein